MISVTGNSSILSHAIGKLSSQVHQISWKPRKPCGIVGYWTVDDGEYNHNFVLTRCPITHALYEPSALAPQNFLKMLSYIRPVSPSADIVDDYTIGLGCFQSTRKFDIAAVLDLAVDSYKMTLIGQGEGASNPSATYEIIVHYHGTYRELWMRLRLLLVVAQGDGCRRVLAKELHSVLTSIGFYEVDNIAFNRLYSRGKYAKNYSLSGEMAKFWTRVKYDRLGSLNAEKERVAHVSHGAVEYNPIITKLVTK